MKARQITVLALLALLTGACGGSSQPAAAPVANAAATTSGPAILAAPVQPVPFSDVQQRVTALYKAHGDDLASYAFQNVRYTPATRDKVLNTCKTADANDGVAGLASTKAVGCAPLIFYYYNYGTRAGVPQSVELAQHLYWFAITHEQGPAGATASLTKLLRQWGIH